MNDKLCDACETVAHCKKNGCVPLTKPEQPAPQAEQAEALQLILNAAYGNLSPEVVKAQARDLVERAGKAHARVNAEVRG